MPTPPSHQIADHQIGPYRPMAAESPKNKVRLSEHAFCHQPGDATSRNAYSLPSLDVQTSHPYADRKSTRLNSSHVAISYAVFCLKKKKKRNNAKMTKK